MVGALATGGVYVTSADVSAYFKAMLAHDLPGVKISDAAVHAFTEDCMKVRPESFALKLKALSMACRVAGYDAVKAAMGDSWENEKTHRFFLTLFLTSTNFFELPDPTARELIYAGAPIACGNPFAQFGIPKYSQG
jgi:hypothetical protein